MKIASHDWAIRYLQDRGLEVILNFTSDHVKHWVIKWQGEQVGSMFKEDIYIRKNLPSLLKAPEGPAHILFDDEDADDRLRKIVYDLLDSPRRYDERQRKAKIEKVREYFDSRKTVAEDMYA
jgi:hypothetical protein